MNGCHQKRKSVHFKSLNESAMTTFYEILGASPQEIDAKIKERYKLLCTRVHPDKGGSKALMQLVLHAYDHILKGKGESGIQFSTAQFSQIKKELNEIKIERDALLGINQQLKNQLNEKIKSNKEEPLRKAALLRAEVALLKEERGRLMHQKELWIKEKKKLTKKWQKALSENETLETDAHRQLSMKRLKTMLLPFKRYGGAFLAFSFIAIMGFNLMGSQGFRSLFQEKETVLTQQKSRVIYAPFTKEQEEDVKNILENAEPVKERIYSLPFLELTDRAGIWSLSAYTGTKQPYIAIRSDNGSYVVNDCSGNFTFYSNQVFKPLRVAANLIYSHQNQYFHVYQIPYGQGSSPQSWLQSRKLQINEEYFTSQEFASSRDSLVKECLARTS